APLLLEKHPWSGATRHPKSDAKRIGRLASGECLLAPATGHFKKNFGHPLRTPEERFQRIDALKTEHAITALCRAFAVAASGYYGWRRRQKEPGPRAQEDQRLKEQIRRLHQESRQTYGAPRIQAALRATGQSHGR